MFTERQTEIINTSIDIIAEQGIQKLTIKNIAKAIGISEPAIYRHFENKLSILSAILDNFMQKSSAIIFKLIQSNEGSIAKLKQIFVGQLQMFIDKPALVSVIFAEEIFKSEKVLSDKIFEILNGRETIILTLIEGGQMNKQIRTDIDKKHLSSILLGSLRLLVKRWEFQHYKFNLIEEGNELFKSIELLLTKPDLSGKTLPTAD